MDDDYNNRMMHPSQNQHLIYEDYYTPEPEASIPVHYSQHQTRYVIPHQLHNNQNTAPPQILSQKPIQTSQIQQPQPSKSSEPIELSCDESVGRKSPEEFPEYVPGAWDEVRKEKSITPGKSAMRFRTELDSGDVKLVNELGQLTVDSLLDYMKNLQNNAFLLGEEEAKEFQRAKCLDIFHNHK
jgi:hypothetical protein